MKIKLSVNQEVRDMDFEQYLQECEAKGYKVIRNNNPECSLEELHDAFQKGDERK